MKLSKNFTLEEFLASTIADEHNITEQYHPSDTVVQNLRDLCINVLQPARDIMDAPFTISSGYRCPKVNELAKGSKTSDHMRGFACDVICGDNEKLFEVLKGLKFKQLINEYNFAWLHISYDVNNLKQEILEIK